MKNTYDLFFALLRRELCGETLPDDLRSFTTEQYEAMYQIAKAHDLAHIVGDALYSLSVELSPTLKSKFQKQQILAVYRYSQINYELEQICNAFEKAQIPFMPLKGSVIRAYYERPEMRTSCDIDIYVKERDLEKAVHTLVEALGYESGMKNIYDVSLNSPAGVHIELHFALTENDERVERVFDSIWEASKRADGSEYHYLMSNEYFLIYHIYHMSKHFASGGCGVRPFMDLWVLKNKMGYDPVEVNSVLEKCGLAAFGKAAFDLSDVWFSHIAHTELTEEMEKYIIGAGVYGTLENRVAIHSEKQGGRIKYALKRIFMSFSDLKRFYPPLERHPILFPYYSVKRWFRLSFNKKSRGKAFAELRYNSNLTDDKKNKINNLCKELDLM